jgi:stage V sporulation protein SpoVS
MQLVPESLDDLVSTTEAAESIGVGKAAVSNWAARGYLIPSGLDAANRPLYRLIDVLRCARDTRRRAIGSSRVA